MTYEAIQAALPWWAVWYVGVGLLLAIEPLGKWMRRRAGGAR